MTEEIKENTHRGDGEDNKTHKKKSRKKEKTDGEPEVAKDKKKKRKKKKDTKKKRKSKRPELHENNSKEKSTVSSDDDKKDKRVSFGGSGNEQPTTNQPPSSKWQMPNSKRLSYIANEKSDVNEGLKEDTDTVNERKEVHEKSEETDKREEHEKTLHLEKEAPANPPPPPSEPIGEPPVGNSVSSPSHTAAVIPSHPSPLPKASPPEEDGLVLSHQQKEELDTYKKLWEDFKTSKDPVNPTPFPPLPFDRSLDELIQFISSLKTEMTTPTRTGSGFANHRQSPSAKDHLYPVYTVAVAMAIEAFEERRKELFKSAAYAIAMSNRLCLPSSNPAANTLRNFQTVVDAFEGMDGPPESGGPPPPPTSLPPPPPTGSPTPLLALKMRSAAMNGTSLANISTVKLRSSMAAASSPGKGESGTQAQLIEELRKGVQLRRRTLGPSDSAVVSTNNSPKLEPAFGPHMLKPTGNRADAKDKQLTRSKSLSSVRDSQINRRRTVHGTSIRGFTQKTNSSNAAGQTGKSMIVKNSETKQTGQENLKQLEDTKANKSTPVKTSFRKSLKG